jgi:hypothetical protein
VQQGIVHARADIEGNSALKAKMATCADFS